MKDLFVKNYGTSEILDGRILLLNKISGIDRRDQVILDGHHVATLSFDITSGEYRLDLELAGAILLREMATKNVVVCSESLLKGHVKGKWALEEHILDQPEGLALESHVILKIGKFTGVGVVRRRGDGSRAIRVKEVGRDDIRLGWQRPTIDDVIRANESHLKRLEKAALREIKDYLSGNRQPVNVSFSGGKDSLAALILSKKVRPDVEVIFIDTGLEFPETVEYVKSFAASRNLRLHVVGYDAEGGGFYSEVRRFGPPSKDYRWCCKTHKLGPITSFIQKHYPRGCVTVEGRRIYESFSRSRISAVEKNPYVPNQTTLAPIRNWRSIEVMLYIRKSGLIPNPLYDRDYERIGCWMCPAALQSEFANTRTTHLRLYEQWTSYLKEWALENRLDPRYVDWGFWRWRRHPPKIVEIARDHGISLKPSAPEKSDVRLDLVRGRSPCGVDYSIEANLSVPANHPFRYVADALSMLGDVSYSESLGAAILRTRKGRCTVYASGHIMAVAPKDAAEGLMRAVVETVLRVQMCTRCGICEKRCRDGAIHVVETVMVDKARCSRCGRCVKGCIVAEGAGKLMGGRGGAGKKM